MTQFRDYAAQVLGVSLPESYLRFMDHYGKKLPEDPVQRASWVNGLGNAEFVIGTTLAFRSNLPRFERQNVVIGYAGIKTILVNKSYEDIDEYTMMDTGSGGIFLVDSLGAANRIADTFDEWIAPELLKARLREKYSSNLTVVVFDDEGKADQARLKLLALQREGFIELEDVVVVVKDRDGTLRYRHMHKLARKGGVAGSITGLIVGSLLLHPLAGAVFGAVTGAVSASLTDVGIEDRFIQDLSASFKPGCSALFTLVRRANPEQAAQEFRGFGGKILVTSVGKEQEAAMQASLDAAEQGEASA